MGKLITMRSAGNSITGLTDFISYVEKNIEKTDGFFDLIHSGIMVEIGSYQGESTEIFSKHFRAVFAVDPWKDGFDPHPDYKKCTMAEVEAAFDKRMMHNISVYKLRGTSADFAPIIEDVIKKLCHSNYPIDLVYIDGNHLYESVCEDIKLWLPKIRKGGFIGGHDYTTAHKGVMRAVDEIFGKPDCTFMDGSWIVKIK